MVPDFLLSHSPNGISSLKSLWQGTTNFVVGSLRMMAATIDAKVWKHITDGCNLRNNLLWRTLIFQFTLIFICSACTQDTALLLNPQYNLNQLNALKKQLLCYKDGTQNDVQTYFMNDFATFIWSIFWYCYHWVVTFCIFIMNHGSDS